MALEGAAAGAVPDAAPGSGSGTHRLPSLTGLRFLAAFVVVLLHVHEHVSGDVQTVLGPIARAGFVGVLFFFCLSGFLLSWGARPGAWAFYRRRFARIYPAFLASLAFGLVVLVTIGRRPGAIVLANLVLLQSWDPHQLAVNTLNPPGWSLSAEAFFYALFPILLAWVGRRSRRTLTVVLTLSWVAVGVAGVLATLPVDEQLRAFLGRLPLLLIGAFLIGMIGARAQREGWAPRVRLAPALAVAGVLYLLCCWTPMTPYASFVLLPPVAVAVLAAAQADLEGAPSVWRSRRMEQLGAQSYCLYLFHWPVLDLLAHGPVSLSSVGVALLAFPVAMALAAVVHRCIEQPAERRLRPDHRLSTADAP